MSDDRLIFALDVSDALAGLAMVDRIGDAGPAGAALRIMQLLPYAPAADQVDAVVAREARDAIHEAQPLHRTTEADEFVAEAAQALETGTLRIFLAERYNLRGTASLALEAETSVPGTDVEHAQSGKVVRQARKRADLCRI